MDGQNRGFGTTHNIGMREAFAAGAEGYLCVNPDAVLHPACLPRAVGHVGLRPRTGLVDARTFPEEHPKPYDPSTGETPWCAGTVLLVRREAFLATGGFDEQLFLYGEDVDLSWRTRAAGLVTRTAPGRWPSTGSSTVRSAERGSSTSCAAPRTSVESGAPGLRPSPRAALPAPGRTPLAPVQPGGDSSPTRAAG